MDRVLLGHVLRSLTNLGIYQTAFQTPFLQQTQEFYATEGLQLMASSDVPDYLKHAEVANRHLLSTTFRLCSMTKPMQNMTY